MSDFRENLVSVTSLEKEAQYATLEPKWDLIAPTLTPELGVSVPQSLSQQKLNQPTRPRPQSFAQKLRSTGKSVKGKLGECILFFFVPFNNVFYAYAGLAQALKH